MARSLPTRVAAANLVYTSKCALRLRAAIRPTTRSPSVLWLSIEDRSQAIQQSQQLVVIDDLPRLIKHVAAEKELVVTLAGDNLVCLLVQKLSSILVLAGCDQHGGTDPHESALFGIELFQGLQLPKHFIPLLNHGRPHEQNESVLEAGRTIGNRNLCLAQTRQGH